MENLNTLKNKAMRMIDSDNVLFVNLCEALDSDYGFLGEDRLYEMDELDEMNFGMRLSEFIRDVDADEFSFSDSYWRYGTDGICSTRKSKYTYYTSLCSVDEIFEKVYENAYDLDLERFDNEFASLMDEIVNWEDED